MQQYLAAGSQDRSFSVWPQGSEKPLLVLKKGFKGTVSDVAWSPDARYLVAVSTDGTALCVAFTQQELGDQMPQHKVRMRRAFHTSCKLPREGAAQSSRTRQQN